MKTTRLSDEELRGVFAVPPLARKTDARRTIDFAENDRLVGHPGGAACRAQERFTDRGRHPPRHRGLEDSGSRKKANPSAVG